MPDVPHARRGPHRPAPMSAVPLVLLALWLAWRASRRSLVLLQARPRTSSRREAFAAARSYSGSISALEDFVASGAPSATEDIAVPIISRRAQLVADACNPAHAHGRDVMNARVVLGGG